MANVRLTLGEASEGLLPETCMKCGADAEYWVKKKLAWHPAWLWVLLPGLIPFAIVAAILTKRATLIAPLCRAHRRHWVVRTAITLLGLLGLVGIIVLLIALHGGRRRPNEALGAILGMALMFGFFAWLIALIVMRLTSIRALEITDYDLILQGVSDRFIDDFEELVEEDERDERPMRRSRPHRPARDDDDFRRR